MTTSVQIPRPKAERIKTQADIVFCIDSTGSMEPCIDAMKGGIYTFVDGLQSAADVDFRLRLVGYKDLHDPTDGKPWYIHDFTHSVDEFRSQLAKIEAEGGGDYRGAESTLDALYLAIHSAWRPSKTHKTILLLTDDNTHPNLHPSIYNRPDNDIYRVIQDFQTLKHVMLFMVVPEYPAYEQLEKSMKYADRKIVANFVPRDDKRYEGLKEVEWEPLLKMLGQTVSQTSVDVTQEADT